MKLTESRLRRAFADVLTAILATSAYGCSGGAATDLGTPNGTSSSGGTSSSSSGGTSSSSSSSGGTTGDWVTACGGPGKSLLQGMQVSPAIDGAMQRHESAFKTLTQPGGGVTNPDDGDDGWVASPGESVGTLCATATNKPACLDKVNGYRVLPPTREACNAEFGVSAGYDGNTCAAQYILFTRGDVVGVARSTDETRVFLAPFDTFQEAQWAIQSATYNFWCDTSPGSGIPTSSYRAATGGGYDVKAVQYENCGATTFAVTLHVDAQGNVTELTRDDLHVRASCAVAGRRPDGLSVDRLANAPGASRVGAHFAEMATLEAASVIAFRRLQRQLAGLGAPGDLLDRVRSAIRDEIRHTRATTALARKYGVTPQKPQVEAATAAPSLMAIALENAREGCVRETFGALVAQVQVVRAADPEIRAVMAAIADEETEHAALSWDIAAWIEPQLDDAAARLALERRDAFAALARDLAGDRPDAETQRLAGVPSTPEAVRMLNELEPLMLAA